MNLISSFQVSRHRHDGFVRSVVRSRRTIGRPTLAMKACASSNAVLCAPIRAGLASIAGIAGRTRPSAPCHEVAWRGLLSFDAAEPNLRCPAAAEYSNRGAHRVKRGPVAAHTHSITAYPISASALGRLRSRPSLVLGTSQAAGAGCDFFAQSARERAVLPNTQGPSRPRDLATVTGGLGAVAKLGESEFVSSVVWGRSSSWASMYMRQFKALLLPLTEWSVKLKAFHRQIEILTKRSVKRLAGLSPWHAPCCLKTPASRFAASRVMKSGPVTAIRRAPARPRPIFFAILSARPAESRSSTSSWMACRGGSSASARSRFGNARRTSSTSSCAKVDSSRAIDRRAA